MGQTLKTERETAYWIAKKVDSTHYHYFCSNCHFRSKYHKGIYCSNCGFRMKEG